MIWAAFNTIATSFENDVMVMLLKLHLPKALPLISAVIITSALHSFVLAIVIIIFWWQPW